jgi:hypothetical protein
MKIFQLSTKDESGRALVIDLNEYQILQLINLCLKRRYNKNIGLILAKIYIEIGKSKEENLKNMGIDPNEIHDGYDEIKKLIGVIE